MFAPCTLKSTVRCGVVTSKTTSRNGSGQPAHTSLPPGRDEIAWGVSVHEDLPGGLGPASREFVATPVRPRPPSSEGTCEDPVQLGILVTATPQEASGTPPKPPDPPSGGGKVMYAGAEA